MRWTPLLEGAEAARAWAVIDRVCTRLRTPSLLDAAALELGEWARGAAGVAAFFGQLERARPGEGHGDVAMEWLERAFTWCGTQRVGWSLYTGFLGVAWAAEWLTEEPEPGLDAAIVELTARPRWTGEYDLTVGLAGAGLWALDTARREASDRVLASVVAHLLTLTQPSAHGARLWTPADRLVPAQRAQHPEGHENLGVAHGQPAVLALLAEAIASGRLPTGLEGRAREVLPALVANLLAHAHPPAALRWPSVVGPDGARGRGRLAWCYGDTGVAATLAVLGAGAGRAGLPRIAEECLDEARETALAAARVPLAGSYVTDAGLCHGAGGNAVLFARLAARFGDPVLAQAARRWLVATMEHALPDAAGWLEGAAGVGLALLAGVSDVPPSWDRMLVASEACAR